jgi:hypothetical protein
MLILLVTAIAFLAGAVLVSSLNQATAKGARR